MARQAPTSFKKPTAVRTRSVFALYFRESILLGINIVLIVFGLVAVGGFIYFAVQISNVFGR